MALIGRVVGMTGTASLILGNGEKRDLKLGDSIQTGDTIQTPRGVEVDLQLANGRIIHISAEQLVAFTEDLASVFVPDGLDSSIDLATIDTVIKAIRRWQRHQCSAGRNCRWCRWPIECLWLWFC